jgi:hypothetical protein
MFVEHPPDKAVTSAELWHASGAARRWMLRTLSKSHRSSAEGTFALNPPTKPRLLKAPG